MKKEVSVIIPVYNEEKDIGECLLSLQKQTAKNFETIVVDDGSTDKTIEVVASLGVKATKGEHKGPGFSRNLGAKKAKGDILIFIDADMTFDKDYIKNLISPLLKKDKEIGSTHDYEVVKNVDNIWSRCWGRVRVSKSEAKDVKIFRAIRKTKFLEMGGFDPRYGYADDQTFWFKYGIKPCVANNTTCYHKNPETLKQVYRQSRWIGASIDNSFFRIPYLNYLVPPLLVLVSPIIVPLLAIKRCLRNKELSIILPMLVFILFRYFGTISGISRKIYRNVNVK